MSPAPGNRRRSHVDMPVTYAAVGASKAPDLMRFPPEGSTPYEEEMRLGSGQDRFLVASSLLMTWGAQRGAGVRVSDIDRGDDDMYVGLDFDEQGRAHTAGDREEHYGPDGEPYLVAGTTAVLSAEGQQSRSVLIIYTVEEDRCVGFAWGTRDEDGAIGEQFFKIEHRDDDTVWAVARGFLIAPKNGLLGLKARSDLRTAIEAAKQQITALAPGAAVDARQADRSGEPERSERPEAAETADGPEAAETAEAAVAAETVPPAESDVVSEPGSDGGESREPAVVTAEVVVQESDEGEAGGGDGARTPSKPHQRRPHKPRS